MSYTINPNAKNRWARNAENTMDLSLETDASSVYLDNGRTLEQEIGEGSMVSSVATIDSAMSKIIDGTLDGAYESLIFKGRTLVNLANKSQENAHYTDYNLSYIDKTKTYFIKVMSTKAIVKIGFIVNNTTWNNSVDCEQITNGYVIIKPNETLEVGGLRVITSDSTTSYTLKTMIVEYQEGMENWDIPYFQGICDVKMPILRNVGKNTFNIKNKGAWRSGWYSIPLEIPFNGKVYVKCADSLPSDFRINLLAINRNEHVLTNEQIKKGHTAYYQNLTDIEFHCPSLSIEGNSRGILDDLVANGDIVIDVGGEPYKSNILRTSEEIVLRRVGGVCDTYNSLTGEYVRRIGEVVLDGSDIAYTSNDNYMTEVSTAVLTSPLSNFKFYESIICENLPVYDRNKSIWMNYSDVVLGVSPVSSQWGFCIKLPHSLTGVTTADSVNTVIPKFRNYLKSHPITVQYELETPITTTIEPLSIPFAYKNGHIVLESGFEGQSLLPTLEYSTVINRTGQIQSIANTIQKQEKQITKLEQMLIQNIINLDYNNTLLTLKNEMEEML